MKYGETSIPMRTDAYRYSKNQGMPPGVSSELAEAMVELDPFGARLRAFRWRKEKTAKRFCFFRTNGLVTCFKHFSLQIQTKTMTNWVNVGTGNSGEIGTDFAKFAQPIWAFFPHKAMESNSGRRTESQKPDPVLFRSRGRSPHTGTRGLQQFATYTSMIGTSSEGWSLRRDQKSSSGKLRYVSIC